MLTVLIDILLVLIVACVVGGLVMICAGEEDE